MTSGDAFFDEDPSARASWRLAVLMGANARTYKFALGDALLDLAGQGREEVTLAELAAPYSLSMVRHLAEAPQAPVHVSVSDTDFLAVARNESEETLASGRPSEQLLEAAQRSMPGMVMQKFHNLRGVPGVPHRFYELRGSGRRRTVLLTPELRGIALSEQGESLRGELNARWHIVESSFAAGVGRGVVQAGMLVDSAHELLLDKRRRRPVARVSEALIGFQHGRCLICSELIVPLGEAVVDHVFPYAMMVRFESVGSWHGPDLDALWNLAPAHRACNSAKTDTPPDRHLRARLALRNEAIMRSPEPLRQTLRLSLGRSLGTGSAHDWNRVFSEIMTL
ncbi:HNH endonuclease signature motif containing protein [Streptomyces sp. NPDC005963]|uniref:HNH endonuclease n=1 Tax=Streptomyces sp. NPDC005963 TaxID=3156721 RepID=UPI0033F0898A